MAQSESYCRPNARRLHSNHMPDANLKPRYLSERMVNVARLATMGEMAVAMAHELNQPLAAIANYASAGEHFLRAAEPDLVEVRIAMSEIAAEALRAGEIIRWLRNLTARQRAERATTDPNELLEELRVLIVAEARASGTHIRFDLADGLPPVNVDRIQVQHAILNLLHNALDALADSPLGSREITMRTSCTPAREVEIAIYDNGPGPAPDIVDRMFDHFSTTKDTGTGLGLPISRTILQTHGGAVGYRPANPAGACFYIWLPAIEELLP